MLPLILRRLLATIPVAGWWPSSSSRSSASPGDPAAIIAGDYATAQDIARIRASLGSTGSLPVQIGIWLEQLLRGDLGTDACLWR
jgi:peptide/nickel transport system permease protein